MRSGIGPERSTTVRQEAVEIQAKRSTRGPESVRKVLQRCDKKQSKYKLNATLAVRNRSGKFCNGPKRSTQNTSKTQPLRSGIGPESFDMVGNQPLLVKQGEGKDSRCKRFRAVSDLFRTCFGLVSDCFQTRLSCLLCNGSVLKSKPSVLKSM